MHLIDVSVTPTQFENFCQNGLVSGQELHRVFVEQVLSVEDDCQTMFYKVMYMHSMVYVHNHVSRNCYLYRK